jgi:hypothetical protein
LRSLSAVIAATDFCQRGGTQCGQLMGVSAKAEG